MAINSVSPGSYNSPSLQPQVQTQRIVEKPKEVSREEKSPTLPEHSSATVNTSGQTVGGLVNTKA